MSDKRSFGTQCRNNKSTAVQTKRLSKEELRYYTKIVEKEKQVLLKFLKATTEYPALRQPHYKINLTATQTKVRKNSGSRKKRKHKKHSSHSSHKTERINDEINGDQENTGHYVSKIVVDDATHCLKLRVRSCKKNQELKENNIDVPERARSRKPKQPRRWPGRNIEFLTEKVNGDSNGIDNKSQMVQSPQFVSENLETNGNDKNHPSFRSTILPTEWAPIKSERDIKDCLFTKSKPRDHTSSPESSPLPTMMSQLTTISTNSSTSEGHPSGQAPSQAHEAPSSDDSNHHSPSEDSDDNQSVCSEEFSIVETNQDTSHMNAMTTTDEMEKITQSKIEEPDANLKDELKKRLKANLMRKAFDKTQYDIPKNISRNKKNAVEPKVLPQVVSVHFYDPQTHRERIVGADSHITIPSIPSMTLPYPNPPSTTPPHHKSPSTTLPYLIQPSTSLTTSQAALPPVSLINHSYSPYYPSTTDIHKLHPAYQIPNIPSHSKVAAVSSENDITIATSRSVVSSYNSMSSHVPLITQETTSLNQNISRSLPTRTQNNDLSAKSVSKINLTTEARTHPPEQGSTDISNKAAAEINVIGSKESQASLEIPKINPQSKKRKRFIFGSHEPPKKKVISSLLTPLCEREATRLADGIHEINMQYFPLRSLAQKAAKRVSGDTDDVLKLIDQKIQLKTKIQDVEKARNLLKDIYDMVLKSKEIEDIQNFELVSHNFGVRNILNHLSLVDLYFGELGSELESKI